MIKQCISIDFDGVIHAYTSPWTRCEEINDLPVEGAFDFIRNAIQSGFHINIHTARANDKCAEPAIVAWLLKHGLEYRFISQIGISALKRSALVYIDDRGWRFEGKFPSFGEIAHLKQWNKK